jgi:hypothetical protein
MDPNKTSAKNTAPAYVVRDIVWLPTYIGLALLLIGAFHAYFVVVFVVLIACRFVLELLYEVVFSESKNKRSTQLITVAFQILVWGGVWLWYTFSLTRPE